MTVAQDQENLEQDELIAAPIDVSSNDEEGGVQSRNFYGGYGGYRGGYGGYGGGYRGYNSYGGHGGYSSYGGYGSYGGYRRGYGGYAGYGVKSSFLIYFKSMTSSTMSRTIPFLMLYCNRRPQGIRLPWLKI